MNKKVVLAFSGGLDTSYCVLALKEQGYEVHTVFVDTGGIPQSEVDWIEQRAVSLGSAQHHLLDVSDSIWQEFVVPLVWSQSRMLGEYPMLCSDRYLIVKGCLQLCDKLETKNFAHGCTGMGNDQLRFDQTVRSHGDYVIHAPVRELQKEATDIRAHEIEYLNAAGVDVPEKSGLYSINENLLGVTISGSEIDRFETPGEATWSLVRPRAEWPEETLEVTIEFNRGIAKALNGQSLPGPEILGRLNQMFGQYGVGRHIYTGDVSIGLKGHIVFECPGVDALLCAHQALEDAVNTRLQNQFRHQVAQRWADLVYPDSFMSRTRQTLRPTLKVRSQRLPER